jgi:toxin ParE1/3/4
VSRRLLKTPEAEEDLVEIALYIEGDNPDAADRLLDQFDQTFQRLSEFPLMGRHRDELAAGLRSFPVGNYVIYYLPLRDGIDVVRVLHGARDVRRIFRRKK